MYVRCSSPMDLGLRKKVFLITNRYITHRCTQEGEDDELFFFCVMFFFVLLFLEK